MRGPQLMRTTFGRETIERLRMERVWAGVLGSGVLLVLSAYLTRAGGLRIVGAIAGGVAAAGLNIAIDVGASTAGWWRYPEVSTPYAPLWYYTGALMGVSAIALIIWRLARRYGGFGIGAALSATAVLFPIRDFRVATTTHVIEFGEGFMPFVADGIAAVAVVALAVLVMRAIAGPAGSDDLARP
jgi:hypothetical protein